MKSTQQPAIPVPDRRVTLAQVNAELEKHGLPPMRVQDLGLYAEDEFQIISVNNVWLHPYGKTHEVTFDVIKPKSMHAPGQSPYTTFTVRFSQLVGIAVVLINGEVLLIKQHRPSVGKWTVELPRAWVELSATEDPDNPEVRLRALLRKEIGPDAAKLLRFSHIKELAAPFEDSGTKRNRLPIYIAQAHGDMPRPSSFAGQKSMLVTWDRLWDMVDGETINDFFSLGALLKVQRMLAK